LLLLRGEIQRFVFFRDELFLRCGRFVWIVDVMPSMLEMTLSRVVDVVDPQLFLVYHADPRVGLLIQLYHDV
jgi:hypothetical protein